MTSLSPDFGQRALTVADKLRGLQWSLVLLLAAISAIGFAMLYSAANGDFQPGASRQMTRFAIALVLWAAAACAEDVYQIVRRIQELAPKDSLSLGIETQFRAASLLAESRPDLPAVLLKNGEKLLAAHPEVQPTNWMVSSLRAV